MQNHEERTRKKNVFKTLKINDEKQEVSRGGRWERSFAALRINSVRVRQLNGRCFRGTVALQLRSLQMPKYRSRIQKIITSDCAILYGYVRRRLVYSRERKVFNPSVYFTLRLFCRVFQSATGSLSLCKSERKFYAPLLCRIFKTHQTRL